MSTDGKAARFEPRVPVEVHISADPDCGEPREALRAQLVNLSADELVVRVISGASATYLDSRALAHLQVGAGVSKAIEPLDLQVQVKPARGNGGTADSQALVLSFSEHMGIKEAKLLRYAGRCVRDAQEDAARFERQKQIAATDLEQLNASLRDLKHRMFTLLLTAITLGLTIAGLYLTLIQTITPSASDQVTSSSTKYAMSVIALLPAVMGIPFLCIFFQKWVSIKRHGAFLLILQQSIWLGRYPPAYRGWEDAYANLMRRNDSPEKELLYPKDQRSGQTFWTRVLKALVDNSFFAYGLLLLNGMPAVSLVLLYPLMSGVLEHNTGAAVAVGSIATLITVGWCVFTWWMLRRIWAGDMSFAYFYSTFSQILESSPPVSRPAK